MGEPIEFETRRIQLRQWHKSDFEPFAAINAGTQVMEFYPEPLGHRASDEMAEKIRSEIEQRRAHCVLLFRPRLMSGVGPTVER